VSPPGGDLSEPVSQATLRVTKTFWGLDSSLAYKKHFPTINWLTSYSLYVDNVKHYWAEHIAHDFADVRQRAMKILQEEAQLMEIVRLVGLESVAPTERVTLDIARIIREDFLFQNAFDPEDAYTSLEQQYQIIKSMVETHTIATEAIEAKKITYEQFASLPQLNEFGTLKTYDSKQPGQYDAFREAIRSTLQNTTNK
jgi:V/A-type H+-transporting ATPase subunit A